MTAQTSSEKQDIFKEIIRTLVSVMEYKSDFFRGHSERVARGCVQFAGHLAAHKNITNALYISGLLHDIGMVYIPMEIVNKTEKLTDEEFKIIREHPVIAENILSHLSSLKNILPIIRHHHENFDGGGYPDGIKGDKIPAGARILSIIDSYDAMTSERPHRPALSPEKALEQIRTDAGTIYDPKLANEFIRFKAGKSPAAPEKEAEPKAKNAPAESSPGDQTARSEQQTEPKAEEKEGGDPIQKAVTEVVLAFKRGIVDVPAFPMVIDKIESALKSPDKGLEDVARIIEQDQVITLRLLSMARSAHYGGDSNIQTVPQALSRIGMKDSQTIVTAIAMKSMYETSTPQVNEIMGKIWIHAVATANLARALARQLGEKDETLFLLGLTHDVGKVLLLNGLAKSLFKKEHEKDVDMAKVLESIQAVHASFGGALLKKWGFKNEIITAVINHETPDFSSGTSRTNLILYLANMLTRRIGYSIHENQPDVVGQVIAYLELDGTAIATLLDDVKQTIQKTITA